MLDIQVDERQLKEIKKKLGNLDHLAGKVIYRASRRAATTGRKDLAQATAKTYNIKTNVARNSISIQSSSAESYSKLVYKDNIKNLFYFGNTSVISPRTVVTPGDSPSPEYYRAKILKSGGYKPMRGDPKPFVQFSHGNITMLQRENSSSKAKVRGVGAPAMPEAYTAHPDVQAQFNRDTMEMFEKRVEHEIQQALRTGR